MNRTHEIVIRPPRAEDTATMLRITENVWEGGDYVPFVWHDWLDDPRGMVQVAARGEDVVGFQHLDVQPDGTVWLEGIRVDPDVRGAGIGSALLQAGIREARARGATAIRLATSSGNDASNRIAEKAGLTQIGTCHRAEAPGAEPVENEVRLALPFELDAVSALLERHGREFYTEGWTAYRLTPGRLRDLLALHAVVVTGSPRLESVAIATATVRRPALRLGLLAGAADGVAAIAHWLRGAAGRAGLTGVRGPLELDADLRMRLDAAGFDTAEKWSMLLWELRLS